MGQLPGGEIALKQGEVVALVPEAECSGDMTRFPAVWKSGSCSRNPPRNTPEIGSCPRIPLDYPHAAEEAKPGAQILLADGAFELEVVEIAGSALRCRVIEGGLLKSRKGVNFPSLNLRLPALTEKDKQDLEFGLSQDVDWISLSFVRRGQDVRELKALLAAKGARKPVVAKIEKPQAIEHLEEILAEADGVMVARGDLGVEISPEKVPMLQKRIIELCNRRGLPVITATQMLESMIHEPRPTRAEASDVANAIIDGTDAVMLSGETAVGEHPVRAVEMMARIAQEVEPRIEFRSYPPTGHTDTEAIGEAVHGMAQVVNARYIVVFTTSGYTARFVAAARPRALVVALHGRSSSLPRSESLLGHQAAPGARPGGHVRGAGGTGRRHAAPAGPCRVRR